MALCLLNTNSSSKPDFGPVCLQGLRGLLFGVFMNSLNALPHMLAPVLFDKCSSAVQCSILYTEIKSTLTTNGIRDLSFLRELIKPKIFQRDKDFLISEPTKEEFKGAVFQMGALRFGWVPC